MPTYDYACDACGHTFELFQQMSAPVKRTCPKCGKRSLQRLIGTGAAVIFKGGGFYETDYRSESYRKAAEAEKKGAEPKSDTAAAATTSTDAAAGDKTSKPDAKSGAASDAKSGSTGDAKSDGKTREKTSSKPPAKSKSKSASKRTR